jgi:hypothetical protein
MLPYPETVGVSAKARSVYCIGLFCADLGELSS